MHLFCPKTIISSNASQNQSTIQFLQRLCLKKKWFVRLKILYKTILVIVIIPYGWITIDLFGIVTIIGLIRINRQCTLHAVRNLMENIRRFGNRMGVYLQIFQTVQMYISEINLMYPMENILLRGLGTDWGYLEMKRQCWDYWFCVPSCHLLKEVWKLF